MGDRPWRGAPNCGIGRELNKRVSVTTIFWQQRVQQLPSPIEAPLTAPSFWLRPGAMPDILPRRSRPGEPALFLTLKACLGTSSGFVSSRHVTTSGIPDVFFHVYRWQENAVFQGMS